MQDTNPNILVGAKPVVEALEENPSSILSVTLLENKSNAYITKIIALCKQNKIPFTFKPLHELHRLSHYNHKGVVAKITEIPLFSLQEIAREITSKPLPLLIALDMVTDVGNFGTIARTLYALGGAGIILPKHGSVAPTSSAIKSSAGILPNVPISIVTNMAQSLQWLSSQGFTIYGTVCTEGENIFSIQPSFPAVLVLGGEEKGIRPLVLKQCTHLVHIPMHNMCNSVNVAQCGAIIMGLFAKENAL